MRVAVITIFPDLVRVLFQYGMVRVAIERRCLEVECIDVRDFATDRYRSVDDYPYGGGPGMVMSPAPLTAALVAARERLGASTRVVLLSAQGRVLEQECVAELASGPTLILICGRYKGVDERFIEHHVDQEISLGDFVLSGGEVAAMAIIESMARLLPGVLGNEASAETDSIASGLLKGPVYTRPEAFEGLTVPEVLTSGHHARIAAWRRRQALRRTQERRPDLLAGAILDPEEALWLRQRSRRDVDDTDQDTG